MHRIKLHLSGQHKPVLATVNEVAKKEKLSCCELHAQGPDTIAKETKVVQVAVEIPENVDRTAKLNNPIIGFQEWCHALAEANEELSKALARYVIKVDVGSHHVNEVVGDFVSSLGLHPTKSSPRRLRRLPG